IANKVPIRLREQASQFIHLRPGTEDAIALALSGNDNDQLVVARAKISPGELDNLRKTIAETRGDLIVIFGQEVGPYSQSLLAQLPYSLAAEGRRVLLHPLPFFNNSVGAHDMGLDEGAMTVAEMIDRAGGEIRAMYLAGSFLPEQLRGREEALSALEFLLVQELFETPSSRYADVVLPAASFAEVDGTFTNNDGFVQRVRQSIPPIYQSKPDWLITTQLAAELGVDFGLELSSSAVFREIAERVPGYSGLRYPLLKDETNPMKVKHPTVEPRDARGWQSGIRSNLEALEHTGKKIMETPEVGHELFRIGTLTDKVPQFHLLAGGNPRPETVRISPLYQLTIDASLRQESAVAGD
ncbi:MAG TPA: molybdopterin-dependent oxidoreductase, partial [Pyrinomonadaceae bacterium]|nr:molybdopterin-dependent oxidoreductase [Pyrinomonadaceae bacterium]